MNTNNREDRPSATPAAIANARHESDEAAYRAQWEQYQKLKEELMNTPDKPRRVTPGNSAQPAGNGKTPGG